MNKRIVARSLINATGIIIMGLFLMPLVMSLALSLMGNQDISGVQTALAKGKSVGFFDLLPKIPSIRQYFIVLLNRADFLHYFWNSVIIVVPVVIGQIVLGLLAAYGFTYFDFRGKKIWFTLYVIAMLLPFQVTLVPNFIVAIKSGTFGHFSSIYLPGIFSAYGIFFLHQFIRGIPKSLVEAAQIDGAGHFRTIWNVIIPLAKPFITSLAVLTFIDYWNLVEQPLIMLQDKSMRPLSLVLSVAGKSDFAIAFAASVIYLIPPLLLYFASREHLESGIKHMTLK